MLLTMKLTDYKVNDIATKSAALSLFQAIVIGEGLI